MSLAGPVFSVIRVARPQIRSKEDKLAFAAHAYLLTKGFRLVAAGAAAEDESADFSADREEVDASGWDSLQGAYAFRYQDTEGRRAPLYVKAVAVGDRLLLHWAAGSGRDAQPQCLELDVAKYTTDLAGVPQGYKNADELVSLLDRHVGPSLVPSGSGAAGKKAAEGAGEAPGRPAREVAEPSWRDERRQEWDEEPLREGPARRLPPGITPTAVGYEDVVPPGFRPPGVGPARGVGTVPGEGAQHPGGGMLVGPGHPMFGPGKLGQGGVGMPPDRGSLPPGAKWDPIGPPGTPGFHPDDFTKPGPSRPGKPDIHPDIMQPGPGKGTDWSSFYG